MMRSDTNGMGETLAIWFGKTGFVCQISQTSIMGSFATVPGLEKPVGCTLWIKMSVDCFNCPWFALNIPGLLGNILGLLQIPGLLRKKGILGSLQEKK